MDTQLAFALGVLTVVVIAVALAVIICIFRVIRHEASFRNIHNEINDCHRHISDTERHFYTESNETRNKFSQYYEEFRRELMAYTDSRVDKSLTTKEKPTLKS
jgi:hypothetical protein